MGFLDDSQSFDVRDYRFNPTTRQLTLRYGPNFTEQTIDLDHTDNIQRTATIVVTASDASAESKAAADPKYLCDGTADDVQINAAIAALPTAGGKLLLSEGQFNIVANLALKDNVYLSGMGRGITVIKAAAALPTSAKMLQGTSLDNVTLSDFDVDMNAQQVEAALSFDTASTHVTMQRCRFLNGIDAGANTCMVVFYTPSNLIVDSCYFNNVLKVAVSTGAIVHFTNNTLYSSYDDGLQFVSCTNVDLIGNFIFDAPYGIGIGAGDSFRIVGNEINTSRLSGPGIYFEDFLGPATVSGNLIRDCSANAGIYVHTLTTVVNEGIAIIGNTILNCIVGIAVHYGQKTTIGNNTISDCGNYGIAVEHCDQATVVGNTIENSGTLDATLPIVLLYYATNCNVADNILKGSAGQDYGIRELTSADLNYIHHNRIYDVDVGNEVVAIGASTKVRDNHGYVTENKGTFPFYAGSMVCTIAHGLSAVPSLMILTPQTNPSMITVYATNVANWNASLAVAGLSTTINASLFYNYLVER